MTVVVKKLILNMRSSSNPMFGVFISDLQTKLTKNDIQVRLKEKYISIRFMSYIWIRVFTNYMSIVSTLTPIITVTLIFVNK